MDELLGLPPEANYRGALDAFADAGWTPWGVGDWAWVLRSPDGGRVVRISPFDPTGPYAAALYEQAAHTRQVPVLYAHRRLEGGGDLQLMEWLGAVDADAAAELHQAVEREEPAVRELVDVVRRVHQRALAELPWCGRLDQNPSNVMQRTDGQLVLIDPFYADGRNLFAAAERDPATVVARIPRHERRYMTEIPVASSGPWDKNSRAEVRAALEEADAAS
jgi:hypothetical protein